MKYSKTISYVRNGKKISYTRNYNTKYGRNIRIIKNKKTGKSYAYREYKVNGKVVRRRIKNVIKDGKLTNYGKQWIEEYKKGLDFEDRNDLQARIISWERRGETVTVEKIQSVLQSTKVERYIYNMGGEPDYVAEDLGVDRDVLFNATNWNFDEGTFTYNGVVYEFTFDYADHSIRWQRRN